MDNEFYVGEWLVRPSLCRINHGDRVTHLRPKVMDLLVFLARHHGEVISKDRLLNEVWRTDAVSESALTRSITELRQAFGDSIEQPSILETIPKRGYRLVASVSPVVRPAAIPPPTYRSGRRVAAVVVVLVLSVGAAAALFVGRGGETHRFRARGWVLITAFDNRTGDANLDGTVEYAFERELAGSPLIKIETRDSIDEMLRFMRRPVDTRIDVAIGREIAARDNTVGALITGRIQKIGSRYALTTGIISPTTGELVAGFTDDTASASDLVRVVRRQALAIRESLGETRESVDASRQQLEKVTTPSLAALQAYSTASATLARSRVASPSNLEALALSAERDLRRALTLDPTFASAQILLAWAIYDRQISRGRRSDATEYLAAADAASRLAASDAEQLFIVASVHDLRAEATMRWPYAPAASEPPTVTDELSQALNAYERYLELRPADGRALRAVNMVCERLGRVADLARILGRVAAMRPNSFDANISAAAAYVRSGELVAAGAALDRAQGRLDGGMAETDAPHAGRVQVSVLRAKVAWLQRDAAAAARELSGRDDEDSERFATVPTLDWRVAAAQIAFADTALGRIRHAERVARAIPDLPARTSALATVLVAARRRADLKQLLRENASSPNVLGRGGSHLVDAGLFAEARRLADDLQHIPNIVPSYVLFMRARIAAGEGRTDECLAFGKQSLSLQPTRYMNQTLMLASDMADAYLTLGQSDEAMRVLKDETANPAESIGRDWAGGFPWIAARNHLAEVYERIGHTDEAMTIDNELLHLLAAADDDYPILIEVKKRIASRH